MFSCYEFSDSIEAKLTTPLLDLPTDLTSELWNRLSPLQRDILIFTELSETYLPMTKDWELAYIRLVNSLLKISPIDRALAKEWLETHLDPVVTRKKKEVY